MGDEPGVQEVADVDGVAAARVAVVVGNEAAKCGGVPLFGGSFCFIDQGANLVLGRAGWAATRDGERQREREAGLTQGASPIAAGRR